TRRSSDLPSSSLGFRPKPIKTMACNPSFLNRQPSLEIRRGTLYPAELRGHDPVFSHKDQGSSRDWRTTTLVAVMSALTLPTVANTSGIVSTASSRPSGPGGRPMAVVTGRLVAMKLTWPGRPTEPMLIRTASAAPVASGVAVRSTPKAQAMKLAVATYWIGLVMRHSDTAIGSTSEATSRG